MLGKEGGDRAFAADIARALEISNHEGVCGVEATNRLYISRHSKLCIPWEKKGHVAGKTRLTLAYRSIGGVAYMAVPASAYNSLGGIPDRR